MKVQNSVNILPNFSRNINIDKNHTCQNNSFQRSVYNSSCPVGANYYNPSFGLSNPKAALLRSQNLKEKYAQKGLNFLLSNEEWSNKKIFKTLDKVGKNFDELLKNNNLSKESLNKVLKVLLPASVVSLITVKDFKDMGGDLVRGGYTPDEAFEATQTYAGFTSTLNGKTNIYIPVNREIKTTEEKANIKSTFLHELKHALTNRCTNLFTNDKYNFKNLEQTSSLDETTYYNDIFFKFEKIFQTLADGCPVKLNKETLVQLATNTNNDKMYNEEPELFEDMDKEITKIIKEQIEETKDGKYAIPKLLDYGLADEKTLLKAAPDLKLTDKAIDEISKGNKQSKKLIKNIVKQYQLPDNAFSSKTFWQYLQHRAMDEKQAYTTDSELREVFGNKKQAVDYELQSLMYGEMEKLFRQKAKNAN